MMDLTIVVGDFLLKVGGLRDGASPGLEIQVCCADCGATVSRRHFDVRDRDPHQAEEEAIIAAISDALAANRHLCHLERRARRDA